MPYVLEYMCGRGLMRAAACTSPPLDRLHVTRNSSTRAQADR